MHIPSQSDLAAAAPRALQCPVIDVAAELAYWQDVHARGELGLHPFEDCTSLLKLGYDVWLASPRATEGELYEALLEAYRRQHRTPALNWDETRWLVRRAWHRLLRE